MVRIRVFRVTAGVARSGGGDVAQRRMELPPHEFKFGPEPVDDGNMAMTAALERKGFCA